MAGLGLRHRRAVGAVGRHRVVGVAGEEDAGAERDRLAGEAVGVAAAVPALVGGADDRPDRGEELDRPDDPLADDRVLLDLVPLLVGQRAGLVEGPARDGELADVVEGGGVAEHPQLLGVHPEPAADGSGVVDDRARVLGRVGVLRLERRRERLGGAHVGAVEALEEADRVERAADLRGDRLEQAGIVGREGVADDVLEVDGAPRPAADEDRDRQLRHHVAGRVGGPVLRLAGDVPAQHRRALAHGSARSARPRPTASSPAPCRPARARRGSRSDPR